MELKSVTINNYKNLRNCSVDFSSCGRLAVLAGVNGSGKSNFLEAIALVYHKFLRESTYLRKVDGCKILCNVAGSECQIYETADSFNVHEVEKRFRALNDGKLIVVYSGEFNRLLDLGFREDLDETSSIRNVILLSSQSYQLLMLTRVLLEYGGRREPGIGLLSLPRATKIRFTIHAESVNLNEPPEDEIDYFFREVLGRNGNARNSREEMTLDEFNELMCEANADWGKMDATIRYFALTQLVGDYTCNSRISDVQVVFDGDRGEEFTSDDLSEGEKWLAMYDAIYACMADENTLVLLDEPDAYIHESKKRDFVQFIRKHSDRGVFTILTTHSPNIINAINEKSLFGFAKNGDNGVVITAATDRMLQRVLIDDRMSYFSDRPILLFEGVSDVRLVKGAVDYFADNEAEYENIRNRLRFDIFSLGGADNMVDAYRAFRNAFPARDIYIALDHDDEGRKVLRRLVEECSVRDITREDERSMMHDAAFLIPRPEGFAPTDNTYVIEDYLPREYIQEQMMKHVEAATCFHKVSNCKEAIKSEIRNRSQSFGANEWRGFKPLIDFLLGIVN